MGKSIILNLSNHKDVENWQIVLVQDNGNDYNNETVLTYLIPKDKETHFKNAIKSLDAIYYSDVGWENEYPSLFDFISSNLLEYAVLIDFSSIAV